MTLPSLEYWLGMLVHDGEQYFKSQIAKIDKHEKRIISLQSKVHENHREMAAHQNKLKPIPEGMYTLLME